MTWACEDVGLDHVFFVPRVSAPRGEREALFGPGGNEQPIKGIAVPIGGERKLGLPFRMGALDVEDLVAPGGDLAGEEVAGRHGQGQLAD